MSKWPKVLLAKYRNVSTGEHVFPRLSNNCVNRKLKMLAEKAGIGKRLSFHVARHTFATTITLSQGMPIETVSRLLGHTNIKTTQIYAKITNEKISRDMSALTERLGDKYRLAE